jgi:hypothetical protein
MVWFGGLLIENQEVLQTSISTHSCDLNSDDFPCVLSYPPNITSPVRLVDSLSLRLQISTNPSLAARQINIFQAHQLPSGFILQTYLHIVYKLHFANPHISQSTRFHTHQL